MSEMPYMVVLDEATRRASVSVGLAVKSASITKNAGIVEEASDMGTKGLLAVSLVTGIPLGIAAHLIAAKIKARTNKEREMQAKIDYYRNAGQSIERGLADQGVRA